MLPTPLEIKEQLLKALNGDNNVIDNKAVLEVISILETYPITRTTLEQTRIGKTVNDLRKKIKDEKLAKRAKQLVRSWKSILDGTAPVNGEKAVRPSHPAVAALQVSPAVSPALGRTSPSGAGRGASPALVRTPVAFGSRSPAAAGSGKPLTPALARPWIVSPALVDSKPGTPNAFATQRVASPALTVAKPRTPQPASTSRIASPVVDNGKPLARTPSVSSSLAISPALRPPTPGLASRWDGEAAKGFRREKSRVGAVPGKEDTSNSGRATPTGRLTPNSIHSENGQDRVLGDRGNGAYDSDSESNSTFSSSHASFNHRNNHSAGASLSKSASKGSTSKDQRDLSKTNAANRKRTREHSQSPPAVSSKLSKVESSSLSVNSSVNQERTLNGCVKSSKRNWAELPRVSSTCLLPSNVGRLSSPKSPFPSGNGHISVQPDSLHRQESNDSKLSTSSRDKHKVKTTEQLIEELQKKNNSTRVGASVINDLRTNQIEKERDVQRSVLPPGVKPKGRRGKRGKDDIELSVPSSDVTLSQAKNELVERFLKSSDPSSPVEEYSPFRDDLLSQRSDSVLEPSSGLGAYSSSFFREPCDDGFPSIQKSTDLPRTLGKRSGASGKVQEVTVSQPRACGSALTLDEIYAQLPPVDDIDWDTVDFYELPEPEPVTDDAVDRLHNTQWPGVNGVQDMHGEWHGWHQMLTMASYDGDKLHILPYVDMD